MNNPKNPKGQKETQRALKRPLLERILGSRAYTTLSAGAIAGAMAFGSASVADARPKGPKAAYNAQKPSDSRLEKLADQMYADKNLSREDSNAVANMVGAVSSTMRFVSPKVVIDLNTDNKVDYAKSYVTFELRGSPMAPKRLIGVELENGRIVRYATDIHEATNWKGDKLAQLASLVQNYVGRMSNDEAKDFARSNAMYFSQNRGTNRVDASYVPSKADIKVLRVKQDNENGLVLTENDNGGIIFDFMLPCNSKYSPVTSRRNQSYRGSDGKNWCHLEIYRNAMVPLSSIVDPCTSGNCSVPGPAPKPFTEPAPKPDDSAVKPPCTTINRYDNGNLVGRDVRCGDNVVNIYNNAGESRSSHSSSVPAPEPRVVEPPRYHPEVPTIPKEPVKDVEPPKLPPKECPKECPKVPQTRIPPTRVPPVRVPPSKGPFEEGLDPVVPPKGSPKAPVVVIPPKAESSGTGLEGTVGVGIAHLIPRDSLLLRPTSYMNGIAGNPDYKAVPVLTVGLGYDFGALSLGALVKLGYMQRNLDLGVVKGPDSVEGSGIVSYTDGTSKSKTFLLYLGPYAGFDLTANTRLDVEAGVAVEYERHRTVLTEHQEHLNGLAADDANVRKPVVESGTDVGGYAGVGLFRRLGGSVYGGLKAWYSHIKGRNGRPDRKAVGGGLELKF